MVESNPVPFLVLGDDEAPTRTGFELRVWSLMDVTNLVNVVPRHRGTSVLEELNRRGGGSFQIRVDDQAITDAPSLLQRGNYVEVILDGVTVFWWYIDTVDRVTIPSGEYSGEWFTVAGPGMYQLLDFARLYPLNGFRKNAATMRYFNFATPAGAWYIPADWDDAVTVTGNWIGFPVLRTEDDTDGWPVTSSWIWDRNDDVMPNGDCYFRRTFTLTEDTDLQMWFTSDDNAWIYIDGELISTVTEYNSWKRAYVTDLLLHAGDHVIGVKGRNVWGGSAGINLALIRVDPEATEDEPPTNADRVVWTGDGQWKVNAYPAGPPGYSAGLIARLLYDEAVARGVDGFDAFTLNFTDEEDSDGLPWGQNLDWAWDVGTSYLEIFDELTATIVDSWIDADRRLNMLDFRGVDKSIQNAGEQPVIFARTLNVTDAETKGSADIRNVVLALSDEGFMEVQGPVESVNTYGRREAFLSFTQANEASVAPVLIQQVFDKFAFPRNTPTIGIIAVDEHKPWDRVKVGDWIKAPADDNPGQLIKRRVVSLAAEMQDSGQIAYAAELDTIADTRDDILDRWLNAAAKGAGSGGVEGTNTGGATKSGSGSSSGVGSNTSSTGRPGPKGDPGFLWRGAWSSIIVYNTGDAVQYQGSSYVAIEGSTNQNPAANPSKWNLIALKGTDGLPGLNWRGTWSSVTAYAIRDGVLYQNQSWISKTANTNSTPTIGSPDWDLLAAKGTDGEDGVDGDDGADGAGLVIIGSLPDEADLPGTGTPGDAYVIDGDLWIWSSLINDWENVGPLTSGGGGGGGGSGGGYAAGNFVLTTPTIPAYEVWMGQFSMNGAEVSQLLAVTADVNARVRFYATQASQIADASRGIGDEPLNVSGILVDDVLELGAYTVVHSPAATIYNLDDLTQPVWVTITNLTSTDRTITATVLTKGMASAAMGGTDVATFVKVTGSLANNAHETGLYTFSSAEVHQALTLSADVACRVRFYDTTAHRNADLARAIGTDPGPNAGLLLDVVLTPGDLSRILAPPATLYAASGFGPVPVTITNRSGGTTTVTVSIQEKGF